MGARFYAVVAAFALGTLLAPPVVRAQDQAAPCGACILLSIVPGQIDALPPGRSLSGLTLLVEAQAADPRVTAAALERVQGSGATPGLILRDVPAAAARPPASATGIMLLDVRRAPEVDAPLAFALKTLATSLRSAGAARVGIGLAAEQLAAAEAAGLAPYFDYVVLPAAVTPSRNSPFATVERWGTAGEDATANLEGLLTTAARTASAYALLAIPPGREGLIPLLAALAQTVPAGLTPLPEVRVECSGGCTAHAYLDASSLDAIVLVHPSAPAWWARVQPGASRVEAILLGDLNDGGGNAVSWSDTRGVSAPWFDSRSPRPEPSRRAVEPKEMGFPPQQGAAAGGSSWRFRSDGPEVLLPAVSDPFVLRVRGWQGSEVEGFATGVDVSAAKTLRVEEIVARHQAADAARRRAVRSLISLGTTVLTFEAPGFAAPLAITAATTLFSSPNGSEVAQRDIRVNGLALATRGDEVPRLPLIEPERVTAPPLAITLNEAYAYRLAGEEVLGGRRCYLVAFSPRQRDRTLFEGRAWIDAATFALVRLDATQTALPGPVVTSREIHDYRLAREGDTTVWLPSRSEIHQVYETAAFATPIHRVVSFTRHLVNSPDFGSLLEAAYRSDAVMMRDTPEGYRYLRRDPRQGASMAARQVIADRVQRVRTIAGGVTIDPNISVPLIFAGVSYVNFNVMGSGAQLDAFFGGTYGRLAWSSPPIGRSGWRASGDAFGLAVAYNDRAFRGGREQYRENVSQRPLHASAGVVGPIAAGLRLRAAYEMDYTRYGASDSTSPSFIVPASTPVHGVRVTLERQHGPWSIAASINRAWRQRWAPWGMPNAAEPEIRAFDRLALRAARSFVWSPRLVARVEGQWVGGRRLDRFSRYAFGTFENPLRGYPSASIRYDRGGVVRSAISWSAAPRLRLDAFADAACVRDPGLSSRPRGYPGVGVALEAPLPFSLLTSLEWGYGFQGINSDGSRGTQVVKVSVYKAF